MTYRHIIDFLNRFQVWKLYGSFSIIQEPNLQINTFQPRSSEHCIIWAQTWAHWIIGNDLERSIMLWMGFYQLFRLGHIPVRKLLVITRGSLFDFTLRRCRPGWCASACVVWPCSAELRTRWSFEVGSGWWFQCGYPLVTKYGRRKFPMVYSYSQVIVYSIQLWKSKMLDFRLPCLITG